MFVCDAHMLFFLPVRRWRERESARSDDIREKKVWRLVCGRCMRLLLLLMLSQMCDHVHICVCGVFVSMSV